MGKRLENLKTILLTLSYAATLTLMSVSRFSTNDQWTAILSRWAVMMLVVVLARIGWMACAAIVQEAHRVMEEKKAKEFNEHVLEKGGKPDENGELWDETYYC